MASPVRLEGLSRKVDWLVRAFERFFRCVKRNFPDATVIDKICFWHGRLLVPFWTAHFGKRDM